MVQVAVTDIRHTARVRPMMSSALAMTVSMVASGNVAVGVVVTASFENASCPLLGPTDALTDSSLGHVDIHPTRILHQEKHRAVAREQDQDEKVKTAVPDNQGVSRQHHQRLAPLSHKRCFAYHYMHMQMQRTTLDLYPLTTEHGSFITICIKQGSDDNLLARVILLPFLRSGSGYVKRAMNWKGMSSQGLGLLSFS